MYITPRLAEQYGQRNPGGINLSVSINLVVTSELKVSVGFNPGFQRAFAILINNKVVFFP
jgi:hypothetical protein